MKPTKVYPDRKHHEEELCSINCLKEVIWNNIEIRTKEV